MPDAKTPEVTIVREQEVSRGWRFEVTLGCAGESRSILLRLDWADYNLWSKGRLSPAEVAAGVVACAAAMLGSSQLPEQADAATLRRRTRGFDAQLSQFLDR